MTAKAVGLLAGIAFGFVLAWARVTDPAVIRAMLLLQEPDVFLLMGSAVLTAAIGVRLLRASNLRSIVTREPIAWTTSAVQSRHITGSALFGVGWSVACTCPGPVASMIGQGQTAGLLVAAGLLSGIALKERLGGRAPSGASAQVSSGQAEEPAGL